MLYGSFGAACAVAVMLCSGSAALGTLLINGDLELPMGGPSESDDATGWMLLEPDVDIMGMPVNSATIWDNAVANHTPGGDRGLWYRGFMGNLDDDQPETVNATLFQDVAGSPGVRYELSAWFRYEANYSGLDPAVPTQTLLALEFLDSGNGVIDGVMLDVDEMQSGDGVWRQFSVNAIAPVGTVMVRARASMVDGVNSEVNPQSAFVDDFVLVPSAPSAGLLMLTGLLGGRRRR